MVVGLTLYKLLMVGHKAVGKTALTTQFCLGLFVELYDPTVEDSYRKDIAIDGELCTLEVLDIGWQEYTTKYTVGRDQWFQKCAGIVLVYDISSRESFALIEGLHYQVQCINRPGSCGPAPVMLVGNKCDMVAERQVSSLEGSTLAKKLGLNFIETSARDGIKVKDAFYRAIRQLQHQKREMERSSERVRSQFSDESEWQDGLENDQGKTLSCACVIL